VILLCWGLGNGVKNFVGRYLSRNVRQARSSLVPWERSWVIRVIGFHQTGRRPWPSCSCLLTRRWPLNLVHVRAGYTVTCRRGRGTPPTMPPAMAPALVLCPPTGIGVAVFDAAAFEAELLGTEGPVGLSIVPGPISGESPAAYELLKSQSFPFVTSRRAQWGTRVPEGIG